MSEPHVTRELLASIDAEHRANGWDWRHTWPELDRPEDAQDYPYTAPTRTEGEALPQPITLSLVLAHLVHLYFEVGRHASQSLCDERDEVLKETRRLLGRIAADVENKEC